MKNWFKKASVISHFFNRFSCLRAEVIIDVNGTKSYYCHGRLHRDDGPAIERTDGSMEWRKEGKKIASATAQAEADRELADAENRKFDQNRSIKNIIDAMREGLPQPIKSLSPFHLKKRP